MRTPKLTEAQFTTQVIQYAQIYGWLTAHFRPGLTQSGRWVTAVQGDGAGFPDLILVHPKRGRAIAAELKVGKNRPTPAQLDWLEAFNSAGVPGVVWRPEDWAEIETTLGNHDAKAA